MFFSVFLFCITFINTTAPAQDIGSIQHPVTQEQLRLYPHSYTDCPDIPSPFLSDSGVEVITAYLKDNKYTIIPVTVENRAPHLSYGSGSIGKGDQFRINSEDFPALAETGLHSEEELDDIKTISGKPISDINADGRPRRLSRTGFLAKDEDIISVLRGDNLLVKKLGLTHSQLAISLFHVWNMVLIEYESGKNGRDWDRIKYFIYNNNKIYFRKVISGKGFQESLFYDGIKGVFYMEFFRELSVEEKEFLNSKYSFLRSGKRKELAEILTRLTTGDMEPYYVMRYGFYEGHTHYRVDPIAISFIFGLKSLEEIEAVFGDDLYSILTDHFTSK